MIARLQNQPFVDYFPICVFTYYLLIQLSLYATYRNEGAAIMPSLPKAGNSMSNFRNTLAALPFVTGPDNSSLVYWSANLTNGRKLADSCVEFMRCNDAPTMLGQITKAQIALGRFGTVEISFWQRIAECTMVGV
jgi:hypothetical protein